MEDAADSPAAGSMLSGQTLFVAGRVHGLTRRRLDVLVRARGGKVAARPGGKVTLVAVAHSAAAGTRPDGTLTLPAGLPPDPPLISEQTLRRALGLLAPPPATERALPEHDLLRISGLTRSQIGCLALFDVLQPVEGLYAYRDLVAAREAARLIGRGISLPQILNAAIALQRRGGHFAEARLTEGPSGALMREVSGHMAELDGQLTMGLDRGARSVDELATAAEEAEASGDFPAAERLYVTAVRADPGDPVLPFNLGNVFDAQGRHAEAKVAWQIAVARDPALAEAWYNLAMAAEDDSQEELAVAQYRRAVEAQPDFCDAVYNLALLLTRRERCIEALPLWERFLELEPQSQQADTARRAAALCRMQTQKGRQEAG